MIPSLQSRLVTLAEGAPNLAAASMHSAFNIAKSIGAWLGGLTIAAGYGYSSPNLVAAGLGALGLTIAVTSWRLDLHPRRQPATEHRAEIGRAAVTGRPGDTQGHAATRLGTVVASGTWTTAVRSPLTTSAVRRSRIDTPYDTTEPLFRFGAGIVD